MDTNTQNSLVADGEKPKRDKLFIIAITLIVLQSVLLLGSETVQTTPFQFLMAEIIGNLLFFFVPLLLVMRAGYRKSTNPWKMAFRRTLFAFSILYATGIYGFIFSPVPASTSEEVLAMKTEILHNSVLFQFLSIFGI